MRDRAEMTSPYVLFDAKALEWGLYLTSHATLERMAEEDTDRSVIADLDGGFRVCAVREWDRITGITSVHFPGAMSDDWRLEDDARGVRLVLRDGEGVEDRAQFPGLVVRRCAQSRAVLSVEVLSPCR